MQERALGAQHLDADELFSAQDTRVSWLGGGGFLIAAHGNVLLIDPCLFLGEDGRTETGHLPFYPQPLSPKEIPQDAHVFYTHADGDHMGLKTAQAMPPSVRIHAPARCCLELAQAGLQADLVRPGGSVRMGDMEIIAIPADHSWQECDPEQYGAPFGPEDCVGYIVRTPEAKLLFTGDTRLCPHHLALPDDFDLMALDVSDDPYHLGHAATVQLARHLSRAALLPCHFGTYDAPDAVPFNGSLTALKRLLGDDAVRVLPDIIGGVVRFSPPLSPAYQNSRAD